MGSDRAQEHNLYHFIRSHLLKSQITVCMGETNEEGSDTSSHIL